MIKSRKDVISILSKAGYVLVSAQKHEKWSDGNNTVIIPRKHNSFQKTTHKIILKRAGLI